MFQCTSFAKLTFYYHAPDQGVEEPHLLPRRRRLGDGAGVLYDPRSVQQQLPGRGAHDEGRHLQCVEGSGRAKSATT